MANNAEIISTAPPHTIKKFELLEKYIQTWAQKLMNNPACKKLVYIDCMCNSGVYYDTDGKLVDGSPIRVAKILRQVAGQYQLKQIEIYFNDNSEDKIALLRTKVPTNTRNYHVNLSVGDGNEMIRNIGNKLREFRNTHFFLFYDPYDASIDWFALFPFFRNWCEVLINHMVLDPSRAIKRVKDSEKKEKYESTYLDEFSNLVPFGSDKDAYEKRVEEIIDTLKGERKYYVAAFPFYNRQNSRIYNLIHCTSNKAGFELYKKVAWQTFGDRSSLKRIHSDECQLAIDINNDGHITTNTDETCFSVVDIAKYVNRCFRGKKNVPLNALWTVLDNHPVFPNDGYRRIIKKILVESFGAIVTTRTNPITNHRETLVSFLEDEKLL